MKLIPTNEHPSNADKTARIAVEDRANWTIYGVRGGYVLTFTSGHAVDCLFDSERAARAAVNEVLEIYDGPECPITDAA